MKHKDVDISNPPVVFRVSLDNGETFTENTARMFTWKNGEKTPWARLIDYSIEKQAKITSLGLVCPKLNLNYNLPSTSQNKRFFFLGNNNIPYDYHVERTIVDDGKIGGEREIIDWFTQIRAIYTEFTVYLIVDNFNPRNSWVKVVNHG